MAGSDPCSGKGSESVIRCWSSTMESSQMARASTRVHFHDGAGTHRRPNMATFIDIVEEFWSSYGQIAVYAIVWLFLLIAFMHAWSYFLTYVVTLSNVIRTGEKNQPSSFATRTIASIFLTIYVCYNVGIYGMLLSTMNFRNAFWGSPWEPMTGLLYRILQFEPFVLVATTWFKVGCASDSYRRSPTEDEITRVLDEGKKKNSHPFVTIVMPIYNEPIETLMIAINSVTKSKYPLHKLHLVLAFDADEVSTLYRSVVYCLMSGNPNPDYEKLSTGEGLDELGVSNDPKEYPIIGDIMYRKLKVTPCRFKHGGKRHAQMCAFNYLNDMYKKFEVKPLLLFIDSDIELEVHAIPYFVHDLNRHTGIYREALTGLITCKTAGTYSFWKVLQDTEYIESQMLQRNTEDYLGSVSCLPGALTMVRFETLARVASAYFGQMEASDTFDFNRTHLGEDRYLTHLIMESRPEKYRIGFCPSARCKTEGCETFQSLMKQRRRWYLGTVTNEIYMLTSPVLWRQFPALNAIVGMMALKNGPLFIYVFLLELLRGNGTFWSYFYACAIFGPIWGFVMFTGWQIKRRKIMWFYPIILVGLPILAAAFQVYGMMTFRVRTWGGPRAAAAKNQDQETDKKDVEASPIDNDKKLKPQLAPESAPQPQQKKAAPSQVKEAPPRRGLRIDDENKVAASAPEVKVRPISQGLVKSLDDQNELAKEMPIGANAV